MKRMINRLVWDAWNVEHIKRHNISPFDVEWVISSRDPKPLFQQGRGGTIAVWGKDIDGRYLLVILANREAGSYYTVTARRMSESEKRLYHRKFK
ncbi:MAG: BrnT family toxin [Thermoleophilia bacterium]